MKTQPMAHQAEGLRRLAAAPEFCALGAEQGTGKTWMLLADAEQQFIADRIEGLLVIAPKGVHTNWVRREVPAHLSVPTKAVAWKSNPGKQLRAQLNRLMMQDGNFAILAMNIDAVNTKAGYAIAQDFLRRMRCMMVVDESQRIKNPRAKRTRKVHELGELAVSRRIASGTLIANSPLDLYSQYEFLRPGLLGTTSYRAFVAEFAELLPPEHGLMRNLRGQPQIVKRDGKGRPVYRNLPRLAKLMAPHTFRVTKQECLDLPEKVYTTHYFDLGPQQARIYESIKNDLRYMRADGQIDEFNALTLLGKLRQATSCFLLVDGEATSLADDNPRLDALKDLAQDIQGQAIIWAHYREELRAIAAALADYGVVEYHGGINQSDRDAAIDEFQSGRVKFFVANPSSGGTGLTLTAAHTAIYYSNGFSLEERLQSEDRCHRIGTKSSVTYIDLVATNTIDERITQTLQRKQEIASCVLDAL